MTVPVREMFDTHPADLVGVDREKLAICIEECVSCAQTCTACADACLSEPHVADLTTCVRSDLDCADICDTTGRVLSRRTGAGAGPEVVRALLEACLAACRACGDECEQHAGTHEHCRVCAAACRRCEKACRDLLGSLSA